VASHAVLMLFLLKKWSSFVVFENAATFQPLCNTLLSISPTWTWGVWMQHMTW
jgi:hypothetical protein